MLPTLLVLFLLTATGGVVLAVLEARGRGLPLRLSAGHGAFGLALLALLILHDFQSPTDRLVNDATLVFVLAAIGGLLLFGFRASRQKLPLAVVLLHAVFALTAITLLGIGLSRY